MNCATHRALALLIAMGGVRISEIAENEAFCWADGWFRVPETKNGRPHDLPITKVAEPVLHIAQTLKHRSSPYLFSNPQSPDRPIQLTAISRAANRLNQSRDFEPWTPRDLRRTLKTHLIERGVDERWLDIWHNHGQTADVARKHYVRAEYVDLKRRVAAEADAFLGTIIDARARERGRAQREQRSVASTQLASSALKHCRLTRQRRSFARPTRIGLNSPNSDFKGEPRVRRAPTQ